MVGGERPIRRGILRLPAVCEGAEATAHGADHRVVPEARVQTRALQIELDPAGDRPGIEVVHDVEVRRVGARRQ